VHVSQLRDWVKKFADDPEHAFPGLNDPGQTKQARPASCHPYQQGAVTTPQPETLRVRLRTMLS
jgi:hypothetical protein